MVNLFPLGKRQSTGIQDIEPQKLQVAGIQRKSPKHLISTAVASTSHCLLTYTAKGTDKAVYLARWVSSIVREEWTSEVSNVKLLRFPCIEKEIVATLQ